MEKSLTVLDQSAMNATNVCGVCREQKRKCDKRLPSCSRCVRLKRSCNYAWNSSEQIDRNGSSPSDILASILQSESQESITRPLSIDRLYVDVVLERLNNQGVCLDQTLTAYFDNIHPWLPVILERPFREQVTRLQKVPQAETALLLLAVVLIMHRGVHDERQTSVHNLFKYLFAFLQLRHGPSLQLVQSGLLLALHDIGSSNIDAACLSISSCARLGYLLKLNFDDRSECESRLSWEEGEERRRLWTGIYILDRIAYQALIDIKAPHVVDDPADDYRLPVDDVLLGQFQKGMLQDIPQHTMSTPVEIPLCYYAREIQAARLLGSVQKFQRANDAEFLPQKFNMLDTKLMQFAERLFEQTPRGWAVLCGANAITLTAALILHQVRIDGMSQLPYSDPPHATTSSLLALSSFINMVRDICCKFNMLGAEDKIDWVPLPAVVCVGEALLAAIRMRNMLGNQFDLDCGPLYQTLLYAKRHWKLCNVYLERIS
ncbi:hypothetical protein BDV59DRAFT_154014 [Aspergillus ambiguus]|uniref:putative C6 transcription factor n=1 Tax=Aspergillus ambiguus TaxID=176160 RepID=UPI003CCD9D91